MCEKYTNETETVKTSATDREYARADAQCYNKADSVQSQLIRNFEEDNEFAFHADEMESQERDIDIMSARKKILKVQF